ncbi:MAG: efflux RND transporter periplasmic adaptor subunit [bacterium]
MESVSSAMTSKLVDQLQAAPQDEKSVAGLLSKIILLEGDVRKVNTVNEFAVLAVNESHKVVSYFQCFMWRRGRFGKLRIQAVSGASQIDDDSPSILTVLKIVRFLSEKFEGKGLAPFDATDGKVHFYDEWVELLPPNVLWCEFTDQTNLKKLSAGLLFFRETPFTNTDVTALTPVLDAFRYSWYRLPDVQKENRSFLGRLTRNRLFKLFIFAVLVGSLFLPVRESVLAPATVIPLNPKIVSSPIGGVVDKFYVQPNQAVKKEQLLFSLDDREIRNEVSIAAQELETAKAEYLRSAQKSFTDEESKAEIELQKARVAQRVLQKEYADSRLAQTQILSGREGVAVFSDENDWIGRPVSVGEKIMTLADPAEKEIAIYMPIDDALALEPGAEVRLFLNTDPTKPLEASLTRTSYQPSENDGSLSYALRASIIDESDFSRLGWQGTAKVYSNEEVTLFYYLFRKPISAARQFFGF